MSSPLIHGVGCYDGGQESRAGQGLTQLTVRRCHSKDDSDLPPSPNTSAVLPHPARPVDHRERVSDRPHEEKIFAPSSPRNARTTRDDAQ